MTLGFIMFLGDTNAVVVGSSKSLYHNHLTKAKCRQRSGPDGGTRYFLTVGSFVFEMKILFFLSSTGCKALLEIKPDQIFKCAISLVMLGVILTISGIITVIEDLLYLE